MRSTQQAVATLAIVVLVLTSGVGAEASSEIVIEGPDEKGTPVETDPVVTGTGDSETLEFEYQQVAPQIEFTGVSEFTSWEEVNTAAISGSVIGAHNGTVAAAADGNVYATNTDSPLQVGDVSHLEFSPDGDYLAIQSDALHIYETDDYTKVETLEFVSAGDRKLFSWSPAGELALVDGSTPYQVKIYAEEWRVDETIDTTEIVTGLSYSPTGELGIGTQDHLTVWEGSERDRVESPDSSLDNLTWSPSGDEIAAVSGDGVVVTQYDSGELIDPTVTSVTTDSVAYYSPRGTLFVEQTGSLLEVSTDDWSTETRQQNISGFYADRSSFYTATSTEVSEYTPNYLKSVDPEIDFTGNGYPDASYDGDLGAGESATVNVGVDVLAGEHDLSVSVGGSEQVEWKYVGYTDGRTHVDTLDLNGHQYDVDSRVSSEDPVRLVMQNNITQNGNTIDLSTGDSEVEGTEINLTIRADGLSEYDNAQVYKNDAEYDNYEFDTLTIYSVTEGDSWEFNLVSNSGGIPISSGGGLVPSVSQDTVVLGGTLALVLGLLGVLYARR
ncbi:WD40 repeat domain-containing protein [Natrinema thermotolerans]|uniref:WD40 repeat domain-containing protein n=1 Tax=Natrinema thermotolerans TaxID=121872 RepID=A0AAF0T1I9_9EURY|nr:WD40 repeat domain-containing protein [Natrinema thermotolerans]QCC60229.1 WD40 repeat domain-containing protein [Natrinema thermotolerans]QCC61139.1 WD40 repeat domain-containing protein [Natrinema thermotolerans]WMT07247.1 WD40 repeat domain-containing protein [Natrinema thermotolerans]